MLPLDRPLLDYIALGAAAGAALALLLALAAHLRVRRLRRLFAVLEGPDGRESVIAAVSRQVAEVDRLRSDIAMAKAELGSARHDLADAIRHISVVRYDAFGDMGGRLSFSAALLDDAGDGLVLTSINGRSETRSYAKGIKAGSSDHPLSPEEEQAVQHAMRGPAERAARRAGEPASTGR